MRPGDYDQLRAAELTTQNPAAWRFSGRHVSPEDYVQLLWSGVAAQFVPRLAPRENMLGLISIFNLDGLNGHAEVAAVRFESGLEAQIAFLIAVGEVFTYAFTSFPLRKLYLEVLSTNLHHFRSATKTLFREEGCRLKHRYVNGDYVDLHTFALYSDEWMAHRENSAGFGA